MDTNELSTPVTDVQVAQVVNDPPANETPEQKYTRLYGTPQTVTPPASDPAVLSAVQALQSEIQNLRSQIPQPPQVQQTGTDLEWVEKIRSGDFKGAEASLKQSVQASIQPQIEAARQQAYQDAISASQVNLEMDRYLSQIRQENPDVLPFERYLQGPVSERMQLAQSAGRVKSTSDFLREYKSAVADEVTKIRNISQQFRAAGKSEAISRTTDVLRSTALNPQQVQSNQQTQNGTEQNQQGESNEDYFARRRASESARRGLS